jgi:hypothetical protein
VDQKVASSTNVNSRGRPGGRVAVPVAVRVVDAEVLGRRCPGRGGTPQVAVPQDLLDHVTLRRLEERHDLQRAASFGTGQRIELEDPLDEHGPGLAGAAIGRSRCGRLARGAGGRFGLLPPQTAGLVRVPTVIPNQVRALRRDTCWVNSARNSSESRIWKFRCGPRASSSRCGSGKARQAPFSAL